MAKRKNDAGCVGGGHRLLRARLRQGKRLFDEDMLACLGGGDDLCRVLLMRRGQDDCVDGVVGKQGIIVVAQREALPLGVVLRFRHGSGDAGRELDFFAVSLNRIDHYLTPSAKADDRCIQHEMFRI